MWDTALGQSHPSRLLLLAKLPQGKKRRELTEAFETMLHEDFPGRVVDFDTAAADEAAAIAGKLRSAGRPIDIRDGLIAGVVAVQRGGVLATRNTKHFADTDLPLVDPWQNAPPVTP